MIDEKATKERFGYYSHDLTSKSKKKILAACDDCGKIREIRKGQYRALCHSCAMKCENQPGCPGCNSDQIECICKVCGSIFYATRAALKRGWGKYCSKSCSSKANRRHRKFQNHHTKPERIFEDICARNNLPFRYVGDSSLWIGKKGKKQLNPDFIEANGKKVLVEIMGDYWHSPLLNRNLREDATLGYRKRHFKHYKWHPIFIWETDLLREEAESFVIKLLEEK